MMMSYNTDLTNAGGRHGFGYFSFGPFRVDFTERSEYEDNRIPLNAEDDKHNQYLLRFDHERRVVSAIRKNGYICDYNYGPNGSLATIRELDLIFVENPSFLDGSYINMCDVSHFVGEAILAICELNGMPFNCAHWTDEHKAIIKLAL